MKSEYDDPRHAIVVCVGPMWKVNWILPQNTLCGCAQQSSRRQWFNSCIFVVARKTPYGIIYHGDKTFPLLSVEQTRGKGPRYQITSIWSIRRKLNVGYNFISGIMLSLFCLFCSFSFISAQVIIVSGLNNNRPPRSGLNL